MKKIALLSLFIIFLIGCKKENNKNDLLDLGLKSKVKSVVETYYNVEEKFGEIHLAKQNWKIDKHFNEDGFISQKSSSFSDGSGRIEKYIYDKGNLVEVSSYKLNGSLNWKEITKYDDKKNKTEINTYNSDGSLDSRVRLEYNDKGIVIESNSYKSNGKLDSTTKYDDSGNKVEYIGYDSNGNIIYTTIQKYDSQNNEKEKEIISENTEMYYNSYGEKILKSKGYWMNEKGSSLRDPRRKEREWVSSSQINRGQANFKYLYKYDDIGNKIEESVFINNNLQFAEKEAWTYDKNGNRIEEKYYDSEGDFYVTKSFEYENNLKIKEIGYNYDGKITSNSEWKFDKKGNKIQEVSYVGENRYEYGWLYDQNNNLVEEYSKSDWGGWKQYLEYDSKNNWIKKIEYNKDGVPLTQFQRKIEYY